MRVAVAKYKRGAPGVGRTATAIHLAAYLQRLGPTMLIDCQRSRARTAMNWAERGQMPFIIATLSQAAPLSLSFTYVVLDAGDSELDLETLTRASDFVVIPVIPSDVEALIAAIKPIRKIAHNYKVLLVRAPHSDGAEVRAKLKRRQIPVFEAEIPSMENFDAAAAQGIPFHSVMDSDAQLVWKAYEAVGNELCCDETTRRAAVAKKANNPEEVRFRTKALTEGFKPVIDDLLQNKRIPEEQIIGTLAIAIAMLASRDMQNRQTLLDRAISLLMQAKAGEWGMPVRGH